MIAVDTSAIMAVLPDEGPSASVMSCLTENKPCMSAGAYSELLTVAASNGVLDQVDKFISTTRISIVALDAAAARAVGRAYENWGKGRHPAVLNFGDCFAYALAKEENMPLLFVGNDFSKTDVSAALEPTRRNC